MDSQPARAKGGFALKLPVAISALEEGRLALLAYLEPFDLDDRLINRIEVVLEEIVSNVVRHAQGAGELIIEAYCSDGAVSLTVEDDAAAFDPLCVPEPDRFSTLSDAVLGGQGIPLIKRLSSSVSYARIGSRNRISVVIAAR